MIDRIKERLNLSTISIAPNRTMRLCAEYIQKIDAEIATLQKHIDDLNAKKSGHQAMIDKVKTKLQSAMREHVIRQMSHDMSMTVHELRYIAKKVDERCAE